MSTLMDLPEGTKARVSFEVELGDPAYGRGRWARVQGEDGDYWETRVPPEAEITVAAIAEPLADYTVVELQTHDGRMLRRWMRYADDYYEDGPWLELDGTNDRYSWVDLTNTTYYDEDYREVLVVVSTPGAA